jgi:hypothetical protein
MLQYVTAGEGIGMGILLHHTDSEREVGYDRASPFGRLDKGLADAASLGWQVIDMRSDWKQVFPAPR